LFSRVGVLRRPVLFLLYHFISTSSGLLFTLDFLRKNFHPGLQMGRDEPIRRSPQLPAAPSADIPDKLYFRIGEVARLCQVPTYVLRFWESEFPQLHPNKGGTGQRLYRRRDVEMALRVRSLLKEEGYTIPGARAVLKAEFKQKEPQLPLIAGGAPDNKVLRGIRNELAAIAALLARPVGKQHEPKKAQPIPSLRAQRQATAQLPHVEAPQIPFKSQD
jgi:DNA-binding transcriptional MerR regulator